VSRKIAQFSFAIAVISITLLIGWAGFTSITSTSLAVIPAHSAAANVVNRPTIPLPQPVFLLEEETPAAATSGQGLVSNTSTEIVPGGLVAGQAVDRMWETTAKLAWQVSAEPLTPSNWFITGIVKRGAQTQIIVQFEGDPKPRFLKIGDVLPGGGRLAWVRPDAIGVITTDRKKLNVAVLHGAPENQPSSALSGSHVTPIKEPRR